MHERSRSSIDERGCYTVDERSCCTVDEPSHSSIDKRRCSSINERCCNSYSVSEVAALSTSEVAALSMGEGTAPSVRLNPLGSTVIPTCGTPWAGFLSHFSRRDKRNLCCPQSVHTSHGPLFKSHDHADCSIPGVLFPGSCRPDCTLSHHPASSNRCPWCKGWRGRSDVAHPQHSSLQKKVTGR